MHTHYVTEHLEEVLAKDELFLYISGRSVYRYNNPYADVPTDSDLIMATIRDYYRHGHREIIPVLKKSILLLSEDPEEGWMATYYLFDFLRMQENEQFPDEDIRMFAQSVLHNLLQLKGNFIGNKRWVGANFANGLWGDVVRMAKAVSSSFAALQLDIGDFQ